MKSKKYEQIYMFTNGEDLPLWTGTTMPADIQVFRPTEEETQKRLFPLTFAELAEAQQQQKDMINERLRRAFPHLAEQSGALGSKALAAPAVSGDPERSIHRDSPDRPDDLD